MIPTTQHCAHCSRVSEKLYTHFPQRRSPYNEPAYRLMYFNDPFFGGDNEEFCSSECLNSQRDKWLHACRAEIHDPSTGEKYCMHCDAFVKNKKDPKQCRSLRDQFTKGYCAYCKNQLGSPEK